MLCYPAQDNHIVLHVRVYDPPDETPPWRPPRYSTLVVRSADLNMSPNLADIIVIATGFASTGIADLMAKELRAMAPPLHYSRLLSNERGDVGSWEGMPWGEAPSP